MTARTARLLDLVARQPPGPLPDRLCEVATVVLNGLGVGLSLASQGILTPIGVTAGARDPERLQADYGEGPSFDASRSGLPVNAPDLVDGSPWPVLGPAIAAGGIAAVFAFPLRHGGIDLGSLTVYRDRRGHLSDDEHADGLGLALLAAELLLASRDGAPDADGVDALPSIGTRVPFREWVVHQACGMVAVQLDLSVEDALARLRAHSFATGRPLPAVAADVVARRIRLQDVP